MNWEDARLFIAIARAGQMLAAARTLGIDQATLSRRMANLERTLGTSLLVRHNAGCHLTEDGEALLEALERAETAFIQAQSHFSAVGGRISGTLRIGAPDGFGVSFLAPRLAEFAEQHPDLTVQLVPVPQVFSLSKREADIAVMVGRPEDGRLIAQKLTDYTLRLYAGRKYVEANDLPQTQDDLARHRLVGYVDDLIFAPSLNFNRDFWSGWRSTIEISSAIGQVEAVRSGIGIGVLHDYLAATFHDLVPVLPALSVKRSYWVVYHESLRGLARVSAGVAFLKDVVGRERECFMRD
jgi:DNA-binding transcriptional LysR family regulator